MRILGGWVIVVLVLGFCPFGYGKDLTHRLGVGYADQFGVSGGLPSVALRYYSARDLGFAAHLGVDTDEDNSRFGFMAKVFRIIFEEDNMNFYMGAGAGLVSSKPNGGSTSSGFDLSGFFGAEFFFSGLDSLGFSFEAGVGVTSLSNDVRFRTLGDSPMRAGMIFYF
ncbi:MAG: organic solvent tolerance protein [Bdellovibrionales bacterium]|nr:organic solvent tolerance protein [Bdellovibrionales bacterium]